MLHSCMHHPLSFLYSHNMLTIQWSISKNKKNIGSEDMEFSGLREMKILGISYFFTRSGKRSRTARVNVKAANH